MNMHITIRPYMDCNRTQSKTGKYRIMKYNKNDQYKRAVIQQIY